MPIILVLILTTTILANESSKKSKTLKSKLCIEPRQLVWVFFTDNVIFTEDNLNSFDNERRSICNDSYSPRNEFSKVRFIKATGASTSLTDFKFINNPV